MQKKLRTDLIFKAFIGRDMENLSSENFEYVTAKNIDTIQLNKVRNLMDKKGNIFSYRIYANDRYYKVLEEDYKKAENFFIKHLKIKPPTIMSHRFLADKTHIIINPDDKFTLVKKVSLYSRVNGDKYTYHLERDRHGELSNFVINEDTYNRLNDVL